ncbi:MAG: signal recognition particle protein [Coriobacteriia bacterium]|nr:signal recognition particle protein [Coriobacteriia bacterium]MCL2750447.1 signal recognition particle protein [Coriobacteriia bacterium]
MFENLSNALQNVFSGLRSKGRLTEADIDTAMREIRLALLEADVNFKVVKSFIAATKEKALQSDILDSLTPAQNVIAIVLEQLTELLGSETVKLEFTQRIPNVWMLVGLQGSGKTTAAAKLAYRLKKQGKNPLLVAADVYRPAAADQLETLGKEIDIRVFRGDGKDPVKIAKDSIQDAIDNLRNVVIIDTAGRLHVDEEMMAEAEAIRNAVQPENILMVVDAMTGQDIVGVVEAFAARVDFDGVIMSKLDGDARGGGALSIREVTGKPILYTSEGEKPSSLEEFHPDRMAKRILGMGDVITFIEKAQEAADEEFAEEEAERLARAELSFDDFITINKQMKKIGGVGSILKALPGGEKALKDGQVDEGAMDRMVIIINSMTAAERAKPSLINGSRRARIAKGAGVEVAAVNQLIKQFDAMRKMLKQMNLGADSVVKKSRPRKGGKKGKRKTQARGKSTTPDLSSLGLGKGGLKLSQLKDLEDLLK